MGRDKANIPIEGVPMADRIVASLAGYGIPATALGRPVPGADCISDPEPLAGPLVALSGFAPRRRFVFVCSCDLPEFDVRLVETLFGLIGEQDGAIPVIQGRAQPLCALYTSEAWSQIPNVLASGKRSVMAWLDAMAWVPVSEELLIARGICAESALGVNSVEELGKRGLT